MELFRIADGRAWFYQWDLRQKIYVNDPDINEVHFCNGTSDCSLVVKVHEGLAEVPNILLQMARNIRIYAVNDDHTCAERIFEVRARSKPADYIYTETEIKRYEDLEKRIEEVKRSIPSVPVKSVNGKTGEVKLNAADVGALPSDTQIPAPYSLPIASPDTLGGVKVGNGLQMAGDVLGVVPEGVYEPIMTIDVTSEGQSIVVDETPDGRKWNFSAIMVFVTLNGGVMPQNTGVNFWGKPNFSDSLFGYTFTASSGDKRTRCEMYIDRGVWKGEFTTTMTGNAYYGSQDLVATARDKPVQEYPAIYGISTSKWPAGTTFDIYGVWKDE